MSALRSLFLALLLCAAQLAASMHAIEHGIAKEDLPPHVCQLCLAAQHLGNGVPAATPLLLLDGAHVLSALPVPAGRFALPAPPASQRAPPLA